MEKADSAYKTLDSVCDVETGILSIEMQSRRAVRRFNLPISECAVLAQGTFLELQCAYLSQLLRGTWGFCLQFIQGSISICAGQMSKLKETTDRKERVGCALV